MGLRKRAVSGQFSKRRNKCFFQDGSLIFGKSKGTWIQGTAKPFGLSFSNISILMEECVFREDAKVNLLPAKILAPGLLWRSYPAKNNQNVWSFLRRVRNPQPLISTSPFSQICWSRHSYYIKLYCMLSLDQQIFETSWDWAGPTSSQVGDFTLFFCRFGLVELVYWISFCRFDWKRFGLVNLDL